MPLLRDVAGLLLLHGLGELGPLGADGDDEQRGGLAREPADEPRPQAPGAQVELEGEEDGERHADEVERHQVGDRGQVLPAAAPRDARQHALRRVQHDGDHHERCDGPERRHDRRAPAEEARPRAVAERQQQHEGDGQEHRQLHRHRHRVLGPLHVPRADLVRHPRAAARDD